MKFRKTLLSALFLGLLSAAPAFAAKEPPVPVRTVAPEYPRDMRSQGINGLVMVKCTIDEKGDVSEANVIKSSNQNFDQYATDAVKKWKFKPARENGNPISVKVTIPIKFVIES
jgi:protein TonB